MDRDIRLFVDADLNLAASAELADGQSHYLSRVMRCADGDRVRVFNGDDGEWWARLVLSKRHTGVVPEVLLRPAAPEPGPVLAMAAIKRAPLEIVIQKATELGVAAIQLLQTDRSQGDRFRLDRLRAIAVEAAEQSERLTVSAIQEVEPLAQWLDHRPCGRQLLVALERSHAKPLPECLSEPPPLDAIDLLIGPEGGFSPAEQTLLAARGQPFSLGPRILRAETAAIAALALLTAR